MAIKACGWVELIEEVDGLIAVDLAVSNLAGETHHSVRAGEFAPNAAPADVRAVLVLFVRDYVASAMGVTFDAGDDVALWPPPGAI